MGFHFNWLDSDKAVLEIRGFNELKYVQGKIRIAELFKLLNDIKNDDYDPDQVLDIIEHEIVENYN
jgi:hypothetical protein